MNNKYNLYTENYETLLREMKGYLNKWENVLCSWNVRLNVVEVSVSPN